MSFRRVDQLHVREDQDIVKLCLVWCHCYCSTLVWTYPVSVSIIHFIIFTFCLKILYYFKPLVVNSPVCSGILVLVGYNICEIVWEFSYIMPVYLMTLWRFVQCILCPCLKDLATVKRFLFARTLFSRKFARA